MSSQTLLLLAWNFLVLASKEDWESQLHGCYLLFPCQLQAWLAPPICTKTNNNSYNYVSTCLFFLWSESRAIVWIQHFQGGLHFKHYLHTIGKFRVHSMVQNQNCTHLCVIYWEAHSLISMGTKTPEKNHPYYPLVSKPSFIVSIDCIGIDHDPICFLCHYLTHNSPQKYLPKFAYRKFVYFVVKYTQEDSRWGFGLLNSYALLIFRRKCGKIRITRNPPCQSCKMSYEQKPIDNISRIKYF